MDTITNIELVKSQLKAQFPKEVVMAPNMTEKVFWLFVFFLQFLCQDYSALMELALCPLLSQYNESSVKMPCESIGVQVFADFFVVVILPFRRN